MTGTLFLAGAVGLARAGDPATTCRAAPALIGAAGAGLIGSAVFTTDPVSGYPPGTADALTRPSPTGTAHNLAAVPVFFGLPAAALACSWRSWRAGQRGFGLYSAGTAITMLATMALAAAGFGQSPRLVNLGGLFQRASIITGFAWLTALSARALQRAPATRSANPPVSLNTHPHSRPGPRPADQEARQSSSLYPATTRPARRVSDADRGRRAPRTAG